MVLQESGEMYLESILVLIRQGKAVRSIDIVDYMGYSKPSVSRAVGLLKAGQYIDVDNGGYITLTAAGREVAEKIYERHTVLTDFLRRLLDMGLTPRTVVTLRKVAPMGDPIEIHVRGYELTLRVEDARQITVEKRDRV